MLKSLILKAVGALGYEFHPKDGRATLEGALRHARRMGVAPATVFDVGAGFGTFTVACARVFPEADYHLIEPLDEFEAALSRLCTRIDHARVHKVAAAARSGRVTLHVHDDLVGSSLLTECEGPAVDGVAREVAVLTVDEIAGDEQLRVRDYFEEFEGPNGQTLRDTGVAYALSATPAGVPRRAPRLGEHNDEVFGELFGDGDELASLRAGGVV